MPHVRLLFVAAALALAAASLSLAEQTPRILPGTQPLEWSGDLAARMVEGVDRFLLAKTEQSLQDRSRHWRRDLSSVEAYRKSIAPNRERLQYILGLRDARIPFDAPQIIAEIGQSPRVAQGEGYDVYEIRWPAFADVWAEGLLLTPREGKAKADIVALPDADVSPEMLAGLADGAAPDSQFARRLAESGCRVVVPMLLSRQMEKRNGRANLTDREYIYRSAFELGRHIIGYETQMTLAAVDWLSQSGGEAPIGVFGRGEGGMLALFAAALDDRIDAVCVSGYFDSRQSLWQEPVDRNVFGLLEQFGDAEIASMIAPRPLIVEAAGYPQVELPSDGGAPGRLTRPSLSEVRKEVERAREFTKGLEPEPAIDLLEGASGVDEAVQALLMRLSPQDKIALPAGGQAPKRLRASSDPGERRQRHLRQLDRHNQAVLHESQYVRKDYMSRLDFASLEAYQKSVEPYRDHFRHEVIGHFPEEPISANPRTRLAYDEKTWTGYEVVLDVFPDVFAYGILLLPKDLKPGEKRPVVVCQHGLEGRPEQVVTGDHPAYHDFAAKLCERGFITFAPQNLYIGKDDFRTLQRKANPLKKTLFSVIVPQHQQIVRWLGALPGVDADRIGFYGLSYGGKSAMRIPPLVSEYALSICSADFNEWVWKNASSRAPHSYVWTGEYEIFEFDLGSTFNYAEMAALIAPRPFMVERGHFDGVAPDETVAFEFAKVRHLYNARLGLGERCELEWFVGPHTIHGVGTFDFLHRHLDWPKPAAGR